MCARLLPPPRRHTACGTPGGPARSVAWGGRSTNLPEWCARFRCIGVSIEKEGRKEAGEEEGRGRGDDAKLDAGSIICRWLLRMQKMCFHVHGQSRLRSPTAPVSRASFADKSKRQRRVSTQSNQYFATGAFSSFTSPATNARGSE